MMNGSAIQDGREHHDADSARLAAQAERLRALHQPGNPLVLINAWDVPSAIGVASAGAVAVATSSAAIAHAHGAEDDNTARELAFTTLRVIADHIDVPLTGDVEGGYALSGRHLVDALLRAGAVGCNVEDTDHGNELTLLDAAGHAAYLAEIRAAATAAGVPIVINARIDTILNDPGGDPAATLAETIRRAQLYTEAGADCVYPIGLRDPSAVKELVDTLGVRVNVNPSHSAAALAGAGAARISTGAGTYRFMIGDLERRAKLMLSGVFGAFS